jgi:pimeloyl-ACP methyl ester carboxylesterase
VTTLDTIADRVRSADGTSIRYERSGRGPALILVDPAGGYSGFDNIRGLVPLLAEHLAVHAYDRRGRGASTDTLPYVVEREIEDLAALIAVAGGSASVYGFSSGALLALHAAAAGLAIEKLVLLEPPFDPNDEVTTSDLTVRLAELVAADRRREAVDHFLTSIGVPEEILAQMEPVKPALDAVAHTLVYDCAISDATTIDLIGSVTTPTLVLDSAASSDELTGGAEAIADALPNATHRRLDGDWHGVPDDVLAPIVRDFLRRDPAGG